jgi:hypothetical protein
MIDPVQLLSHPVAAVALRTALGSYVIYMARKFYADPTGYFRKSARNLVDLPWLEPVIRALAAFCLWGGCFIIVTAVAVQILGLHGDLLALVLITLAAFAAWLLLPGQSTAAAEDNSSAND